MKKNFSVDLILIGLLLFAGSNYSYAGSGGQKSPPAAQVNKKSLALLLNNANALIKSGKPGNAYEILEPEEDEYSGEVEYDYLLGISALDSGKPDRATIAFERVLIVNPKFAGARLDLARAYLIMGSDDFAKKELETVLTQSPPAQVIDAVQKFLAGIEERRRTKFQRITSYLESSVGFDDNITAATPDFTAGVQGAFRIPNVLPTGSSLQYQGIYESVSGGIDISRKVNEEKGISLFAGADLRKRFYNILGSMNNDNLDCRAGMSIAQGEDNYRLTTSYGKYLQTGFIANSNNDRNTAGISAEWKRNLSERNQMTWLLQYSQPRFLMMPSQDTDQVLLSVSWLHLFEGHLAPLIFTNIGRSVDYALRASNAQGSTMSRTGTSLMMHSQITPMANTDIFLSGSLSVRHDDSPNARSQLATDFFAQDVTQNISIGFVKRPWASWSIKGMLAWTNNNSNLELYNYHRLDSSVSIRKDF